MSGAIPRNYHKAPSERRKACLKIIRDAGEAGITDQELQRRMRGLGFAPVKTSSILIADDMIYEDMRRRYGGGQQWETWYVWCGKKEVEE